MAIQNQCCICDRYFTETKEHTGCICPDCMKELEEKKPEQETLSDKPSKFYRIK